MKVILIVIDTLRADHLSCYGYDRKTSPNIDEFASQGVLFSRAYPTDVPTQPSYTAMFTGQRGVKTGIVSHSLTEDLRDDIPFLPQILAEHGYTTAAVSTLYSMRKWFSRGFQYYMNPAAGAPSRIQTVDADEINSYAIPWIKQNSDKDFFMFVHYWDPHEPYTPPKKYRELWYEGDPTDPSNHSLDEAKKQILWPFIYLHLRTIRDINNLQDDITDIEFVRAQYDGEISYVDEKVGELLRTLDEVGITDDTLVILTADHGESLGEHHFYFDHADVYEPTIHVPLIIRHPQIFPKGKRIEALVQLIDIPYLILELLEVPIPDQFQGRSLKSLIYGEAEDIYSEIYSNQGLWSCKRTIITK
ncbi:sulfatase, partial [Candidatus Bathyarchaeota archaeon]